MEVILLERIARLGQMGDVVRVKDGFARNFLLPRGKALRATADNKSRFEGMKAELQAKNLEMKGEAGKIGAKVDGKSYVVIRQASESGALFGSVSTRDIAALIKSVQEEVRNVVRGSSGFFLDFFDPFLAPLENELKTQSTHVASRTHRMADTHAYATRIDATNFALANDDGSVVRDYERADVILVGVSRSGKTPTCLYLAMQYGIFAANYPLTEDDLESRKLPRALESYVRKLFALTIKPDRLQQIRNERRPDSRYSSAAQVAFEVRAAESLLERYGIPMLDATEVSIEEISSRILDRTGIERRLRP